MKIGITERGDAALDLSWKDKLDTVDGAVLITKRITKRFGNALLDAHRQDHKLILHATCTGQGGTDFEPFVPKPTIVLRSLKALIDAGFPAERCVLRVDPIIPTPECLKRVKETLDEFQELDTGVTRVRVSILDEYRHVKDRLRALGLETIYPGSNFSASTEQFQEIADLLSQYPYTFETCAEPQLVKLAPKTFKAQGCISTEDLKLLDIAPDTLMSQNKQNRYGCLCLSCKTELLTHRGQCPHQCVYCYWKGNYKS